MVIHNFDFVGAGIRPNKADTVLLINADTVLPFPVS